MILKQRLRQESAAEEIQTLPSRERDGGDVIVLGRNTFKEVVRGIHEGHLLPLDYVPPTPPEEPMKEESKKRCITGENRCNLGVQPRRQRSPEFSPTTRYSVLEPP